ncbi:23S rRNA pseudouridine1911/1915/1917 synthase [Thermosporothrix hazakensis]|jgi:23S rRNA pseudouridine1911/1915/1917 synthase|uniref:Pseudouridine synthase n=3 Tax=Thermosporothrix TaxID=768650 RepID=A0A326U8I5_THEHA|nr:23S rRNA pseudouridine1911/1915/1917 synthase [Thermosporothrix hazakensis]BBH91496.1 putative RNA pseudouridine synthase YlyB [Thermosporothrix sp. COM3]GCE49641.1 putative RNA pseudouridine synthase YlyB [Thermosporothrix hazakensis]
MHNMDGNKANAQQIFAVEPEAVGQRLDRYLVARLTEISRSGVQQLIDEGAILVNGRARKPGYALRANDTVEVLQATVPTPPQEVLPLPVALDILYEDDDLLVLNKPAGMVVHPAPGHYEDTLVNALVARYPQLQDAEGDMRPGIVHRLDKDTSGLLIVAKNRPTQALLVEMMKQRAIIKRYLALVEGNIALDKGSIDAPIGRDPRNRQLMAITATGSRDAVTHFRVLKRFARHTLVLAQLETGRTHQIRVHFKAIGHPIAGDPTYGSGRRISHHIQLGRQFLHASQLQFEHPRTGEQLLLEAPLPADLQNILENEKAL